MTAHRIDEAAIARYRRDGFLAPLPVMDEAAMAAQLAQVDALAALRAQP